MNQENQNQEGKLLDSIEEPFLLSKKPSKKGFRKVFSKWREILIGIVVFLALIIVVQVVNSTKYKMVVNVVEGENIMGVNPTTEKLDFGDLSRNNGMARYITLSSKGNMSTFIVVLKFGEVADLIKLNKNYFTLGPGEETRLSFEISIPPSAEIRKYSGWAVIFRLPKPI